MTRTQGLRVDEGGVARARGTGARTVQESAPPAAQPVHPRVGPNVVMIVLDDVGFAQLGCFGSNVATPNFDRLASGGIRYNGFHVTSLCSPTRACLLTGRNHHAVGMGFVPDLPSVYPGYSGRIPRSAATVARVLRDAGYSTHAVGKWHLTPRHDRTASGPFGWWPLGQGFERYYGFLHAETSQWTPNLVSDNHFVAPPRSPDDGYHLTEDLVDTAMRQVLDQQQATSGKPFFLYFAPGAQHAPHQVPREWTEHYRGQFDGGWERWRDDAFRRQVASGVVPEGTVCTPRPDWVQQWDDLPADERALYARMQEVFAGFMSHTDHHVGRLISFLEEMELLDDTVVMLLSDNGASAEGGPIGTVNEKRGMVGRDSIADNLDQIESLGGFGLYNHYAWGWAWAGNTPFRLWKRYAWLGGTRVPLVVHWPKGISARGEIRSQFAHAIDLMPTILDVCGVDPPAVVDGVTQQAIDGASLRSTFDDPDAPDPRTSQYFEMLGSRSMYADGWKATTDRIVKGVADEDSIDGSRDLDADVWSLFDLGSDFSEAEDLAGERPDHVQKLEHLWWAAAGQNQVLPMGDRMDRVNIADRLREAQPGPYPPRGVSVFRPGGGPIAEEAVPSVARGGRITIDLDVPDAGAEGILCVHGDWTGGWALYVRDGRLSYALNAVGNVFTVAAEAPLVGGRHRIVFEYRPAEGGGGEITLAVGDDQVASLAIPPGVAITSPQTDGSGLRIGHDEGFPVCHDYEPPFAWTGTVHQIVIDVTSGAAPKREDEVARALRHD